MALVVFTPIEGLLLQSTHLIVRRVAISKSVGGDQVDEVPRIQAHMAALGGIPRLQGIRMAVGAAFFGFHREDQGLRGGTGFNDHRKVAIGRILGRFIFQNANAFALGQGDGGDGFLAEGFYQKFNRIPRHAYPPVWRIHSDRQFLGAKSGKRKTEGGQH